MIGKNQLLSTSEFALKTGIASSRVSRLIRKRKIEAEKISGKWMIHPRQLKIQEVQELSRLTKSPTKQKAVKTPHKKAASAAKKSTTPKKGKPAEKKIAGAKAFSVTEFVDMTYLTEFGVIDWLKKGRLIGKQNAAGEWLIDAANLDAPGFQRLVR